MVIITVVGLLAAVGLFQLVCWLDSQVGLVSHWNGDRITTGMSLSDVESLMGGPGEVIRPDELPMIAEGGKLVRSVTGDEFFGWRYGQGTMIVGFRDGKVIDKDGIEPNW